MDFVWAPIQNLTTSVIKKTKKTRNTMLFYESISTTGKLIDVTKT